MTTSTGHCRGGARRAALAGLGACLVLALAAPGARADPYGELARTAVSVSGLQFSEATSAFGVNPTNNDLYVGEEVAATPGEYRILRFNSSGTLLAQSPVLKPKSKSPLGIEGVAVDPGGHRVYVLGLFERGASVIDPEAAAAGTLYALNAETLESEVAEQGEGVLDAPAALGADKGGGKALLNPRGIAVDPTTHEVVLLGEVDTGTLTTSQRHLALERVSSAGALLAGRYVDANVEPEAEVDSPVVTAEGDVLAQRTVTEGPTENLKQILQFPRGEGSTSPPAVVFEFPLKASEPGSEASREELLEALELKTEPPGRGASLALASEGQAKGVLYSLAEVAEQAFGPSGVEAKSGFPGALLVNVQDVFGAVTTSERGWTGGASPAVNPQAKCAIAEREGVNPLVGAGSEGHLFVLDPATAQVIQFGSGGEGCPHATAPAASPIELSDERGVALAEAAAGIEATFSTQVMLGNVLSSEWNFGDGTPVQISTAGEYQLAEAHHTFSTPGTYTVTENIKTDNLATPELTVQRSLNVLKAQTVTFTSTAPESAVFEGPSYIVTAGASSGLPVELSSATPEHCSLSSSASGAKVSFIGAGSCTIDADQAGNGEWAKAKRETQSFQVAKRSQTVTFTSAPPENAKSEGPAYTATARGGASGEPVELTIAAASTSVCSISGTASGSSVSFIGAGTCTIDANQKGNANYAAAPQVQQSIAVEAKPQPIPGTPPPTPTPPSASTPPAGPSAGLVGVLSYRAGLGSTTLTVSGAGVVLVKVKCLGTSSCTGKLTLRTLRPVRAAPGKRKAVLVLASGSFALHGGQTKALALRLTPTARKLLARLRVLRARAVILAKDASGAAHSTPLIVTLRAAKNGH